MRRALAQLMGLGLLLTGIVLGLYGVFTILYGGDEGRGDAYVELAGKELGAVVIGAVALSAGFFALLSSVPFFRWSRRRRLPQRL